MPENLKLMMPIKTQTSKAPRAKAPTHGRGAKAARIAMERDFAALVDWLESTRPILSMCYFVLPMPPNIANQGLHWRSKKTLHDRYFEMCSALKAHGLMPKVWTPTPDVVSVSVVANLKARMDTDNLMARLKFPCDWLVRNGFALDDSEKHWRYRSLPTQRIVAKKQPDIIIPTCPCLEWSFSRERDEAQ